MLLRLSVCVSVAALVAAKPLVPNQNPELSAWEDELIKARVDVPEDPALNATYNRAKHPDERHSGCSRKRAEGAGIVGYCAHSRLNSSCNARALDCTHMIFGLCPMPASSSPVLPLLCRLVELDGGRCGTR